MVNKISPEVSKIKLTTRKRKAHKTFPQPTSKKRFVAVDNGGLVGYMAVTEGEMACANGNTEDIDICSETEANTEPGDDKIKEKVMNENEKGEQGKKSDQANDPAEEVEVEDATQRAVNEKILSALSEASKERSEMQEFMRNRIEEISATVKRVEEKANEINGIKEDVIAMKNNFEDMNKRVSDLANAGERVSKEIKEHFKRVEEEERGKRHKFLRRSNKMKSVL